MSAAAGSSAPPPPPGDQGSPKNTGHQVPALRSGNGNFKHSAMWSTALNKDQSKLPGFVVDTMFLSAARWIRVTASEAREWAQRGATVYNGYTLEAMDSRELPQVPMANPAAPGPGSGAQAVTETTRAIEEQLERTNDEYANTQRHHATPPSSPPKKGHTPRKDDSSGSSGRGGGGSSIFSN